MEDEPGTRGQALGTAEHRSTFDSTASNMSLERKTTPLCFCESVHVSVTSDVGMRCASEETAWISCDSLRQRVQLPGSVQHVPAHRAAASRQHPGSETPPPLSTSKEDCVPAGDNLQGSSFFVFTGFTCMGTHAHMHRRTQPHTRDAKWTARIPISQTDKTVKLFLMV